METGTSKDFSAAGPRAHSDQPLSRKKWLIPAIVAGAAAALFAAGVGFLAFYQGKALPGTSVAGESVSGMNQAEITQLVTERADGVRVSLTVDGTETEWTLAELGFDVDGAATANEATGADRSFFGRAGSVFKTHDYAPVTALNQPQLDAFTDSLNSQFGVPVQDAEVTFVAEEGRFVASEASAGRGVDEQAISSLAATAAEQLTSESATFESEELVPVVSTQAAQSAAESATVMIAPEVIVTDGITEFEAEPADKASWVEFPITPEGMEAPVFDTEKVRAWVEELGASTNDEPVTGINNVNSAGEVLVEAFPAKDGLHVNNADAVTTALLDALGRGEAYNGSFDYEVVPATYTTRPILAGAENLPYPAAEGEKWVDINLSTYSITPYIGLDPVREAFPMVPGKPSTPTVTGTYNVYLKYEVQDMGCTPEWSYCARDVPWVTYFTGSYAMHGAPWQPFFGPGAPGSAGCLNMPTGDAQWIYDWTELGTPVVSHY